MPPMWEPGLPGVLVLPSGRSVRGRGLRHGPPAVVPDSGVYLLGKVPPSFAWPSTWLRWPDFRLPADRDSALAVLDDVLERSATERVELACSGGRGRTGTALAVLAALDGVPAAEAVGWVRERYDDRAVETPRQRRWVRSLGPYAGS